MRNLQNQLNTLFHLKGKIRKFIYLAIFFSITPATLGASLLAVNMLSQSRIEAQKPKTEQLAQIQVPTLGANVYASLPNTIGEVKGAATAQDARYEIVHQYLVKYNSPLEPHTQFIIDTAEKYTLDFRLIVAIAQQESNLCKKIPENSHNCWGWGIHERGTLKFDSYEEAIEAVSKGLKEEYYDKGYNTPEQIMAKYTPSSPGTWARGVSQFLQEME